MLHKAGSRLTWLALGLPLSFLSVPAAHAQMGGMGPGMGGMGPMGRPQAPTEAKDEGPAEEAPDATEQSPSANEGDTGYLNQAQRRTKAIEVDGYFRFRGDWFYKLHMSQGYANSDPEGSKPPFPVPSDCIPSRGNTAASTSCSKKSIGTGNLRLRLEPTINVTDQVRVRTQLDVFDNLVMGTNMDTMATADSTETRSNASPAPVLSTTTSGYASSILAKRAWGEVDTEFGSIRFGRMPWHFGRGMYFNRGDGRDSDHGTSVDRIMFLTTVYGHQLSFGYDFGSQGYTQANTNLGYLTQNGFPLDLTQKDDVTQYMASITKIDSPQSWKDRIAAGDLVLNYGAQVVYRSQDKWTYVDPSTKSGDTSAASSPSVEQISGGAVSTTTFKTVNANALLFIPSIWFKLGWKALTLEFEGTLLAGKMGDAGPLRIMENGSNDRGLKILQAGYVLASSLKLYQDSLYLGFETGGATGDTAELSVDYATGRNYQGYLNYRYGFVPQPTGDKSLNNFHFSPEYHVDEIFFRRIKGTVSNAVYVKPSVTYWLAADSTKTREIGLTGAGIYSMAAVPVSTPGNGLIYGFELNLGATYRNNREGFYAGATWAVFWPLGALDRPLGLWPTNETAKAPQAFRTFLGIKF